ncbi:MAG: hypothetical protein GWN62_03525 [Aliifodinibius sp.]|nr:hypothetical protein [Fodinibius sp.]
MDAMKIKRSLIILWGSALFCLGAFSLWGVIVGEFIGYLVFSLLVASLFVGISALIVSIWNIYKLQVSALWFIFSFLVLLFNFSLVPSFANNPDPHNYDILLYCSMIVSFPSSLVLVYFFGYIAMSFNMSYPPSDNLYVGYIQVWLPFVVVGYLQWFQILPRLFALIKKRFYGQQM